ncbi:hypothetical protein Tco_1196175 [Tanacetum coccineum]
MVVRRVGGWVLHREVEDSRVHVDWMADCMTETKSVTDSRARGYNKVVVDRCLWYGFERVKRGIIVFGTRTCGAGEVGAREVCDYGRLTAARGRAVGFLQPVEVVDVEQDL